MDPVGGDEPQPAPWADRCWRTIQARFGSRERRRIRSRAPKPSASASACTWNVPRGRVAPYRIFQSSSAVVGLQRAASAVPHRSRRRPAANAGVAPISSASSAAESSTEAGQRSSASASSSSGRQKVRAVLGGMQGQVHRLPRTVEDRSTPAAHLDPRPSREERRPTPPPATPRPGTAGCPVSTNSSTRRPRRYVPTCARVPRRRHHRHPLWASQ